MDSFLNQVIKHKRAEIAEKEMKRPLSSFKHKCSKASKQFELALQGDGLKIIAELKPRSPSLGQLDQNDDLICRLEAYQKYAACVSVLCDERFFGGSIALLESVTLRIKQPCLLKDFVISEYQVYEGRQAGAEAVLLIAKILDFEEFRSLFELIAELGMTAVVEVQTEAELKMVEPLKPSVVLINNRNLDNLQIDLNTTGRLATLPGYPCKIISASGIESGDDLLGLRSFASCFLIGSALMKSADIGKKFEEFFEAEKSFLKRKKEEQRCSL